MRNAVAWGKGYARNAERDDLLPPLLEALIIFLSFDLPGDLVRGVFCAEDARGLRWMPGLTAPGPFGLDGFDTPGLFGLSRVGCDKAGPVVESRIVASADGLPLLTLSASPPAGDATLRDRP